MGIVIEAVVCIMMGAVSWQLLGFMKVFVSAVTHGKPCNYHFLIMAGIQEVEDSAPPGA